jgi:hypothetical protein
VGAATVAAAAALVFTFLPTALEPAGAPRETAGLGGTDAATAHLVQELRQIEEDRLLRKVPDEDARSMALPLRRDLAIALATADAEARRDTLAASLTGLVAAAAADERGDPQEDR